MRMMMTMKSRMMGMAIVQSLHLYPYCVCRVSYVAIITHNYCISSPADDDLAILAIITQISPFPVVRLMITKMTKVIKEMTKMIMEMQR